MTGGRDDDDDDDDAIQIGINFGEGEGHVTYRTERTKISRELLFS